VNAKILEYWDRLQSSFWFVPALMAAVAAAMAAGCVALDQRVTLRWLEAQGWAYTGGAEGASLVLSTIAGSMITIAGVVFSMTLVALSLASSQLGPRLLRNFMRDRVNQAVLGTFIATFVYCLLVLRTIRHAEEIAFVPHLAVTLGVVFALASLGVLIYFIHHVAVSIQADEVIAKVGAELIDAIDGQVEKVADDQPPPLRPAARPAPALPPEFDRVAGPVAAVGDGYLQIVDIEALVQLAVREDLVLRLERRPGQYVVKGRPVVLMMPGDRRSDALAADINAALVLGSQRTPTQDIEFAVHQLVEIAIRALSPGINDSFTALACIDRLGSGLCHLAQQQMPLPLHFDREGRLRVLAPKQTFTDVADAAFNQIRQSARANTAVAIRLLETIETIAGAIIAADDRAALRRHAEMIGRGAREAIPDPDDRIAVELRLTAAQRALAAG
jgi:uncharacterized membrane protein